MWLLRDFTLELVDLNGKPISSKQYLENALSPVADKAGSDRNKTKNEIRRTVTQFFRDRDCVTLVRPTVDEKDLRHIDKIQYKDLRQEFRKQVEALRNHVINAVEFKTIMGRKMNGEEFGIVCKSYVDAINQGAVPDLKSAWENIGLIENPRAAEESLKSYTTKMKVNTEKAGFPMPDESLDTFHRSAEDEAIKLFNSRKIGDAIDSVVKDLKDKIYTEYLKYQAANREKSVQACKAIFDGLSSKVDEKVTKSAYRDVTDLLHDLDTLNSNYLTAAKNQKISPISAQAEFYTLAPRFWNSVLTRTAKYLLREQEQKYSQLQLQLTELQKTYDLTRSEKESAMLEKVRLESLKAQLEKDIAHLKATLKDAQVKLAEISDAKSAVEAELKKANTERASLEKKMQEEKEANANAIKEVKKNAKLEREQLVSTHDSARKDLEARINKLGNDQTALQATHKHQVDKLQGEKDSLQRSLNEHIAKSEQEREAQSKQAKKDREGMTAELAKEKTEKDTLSTNLHKEKAEREALASHLAKERNEKEKLAAELSKTSAEKDGAHKKIAEMQAQLESDKKEASKSTKSVQKELAELQKKLEAEAEARKKEVEEKDAEIKKAQNLTKSIKKKLETEEDEKKKALEERNSAVQNLEGKGKGLEREVVELQKKLEASVAEIKKLKTDHEGAAGALEEKVKATKQKKVKLAQEKKQLLEERKLQSEDNKRLEDEKEQWTEEKKALLGEKKQLMGDRKQLGEELETRRNENEKLQKEVELLREMRKENEALQKEIDAMKQANANVVPSKAEKSRKLTTSNENNNNHTANGSSFAADEVAQPETKKRRVSIFQSQEPTTPAKKAKVAKTKTEKPQEEEAEPEESASPPAKVASSWPDPNTLTIPALKRQLTKWNIDLPAQAEKKVVYLIYSLLA